MQKQITFTAKHWNEYAILINYKGSLLKMLLSELSESNRQALIDHPCNEWNLSGFGYWEKFVIDPESLELKMRLFLRGKPLLIF